MNDVLAFLAALDCHPSAVIVQTPDLHRVAYYEHGTVYTRSTDPAVLVHETVARLPAAEVGGRVGRGGTGAQGSGGAPRRDYVEG